MSDVSNALNGDPFLVGYQPSELQIASEFLTMWLPFLTRDLCRLSRRSLQLSRRPRSVLVLKGRGADVAKHCVPAVPTKRGRGKCKGIDDISLHLMHNDTLMWDYSCVTYKVA